jgi:hypothetical protein
MNVAVATRSLVLVAASVLVSLAVAAPASAQSNPAAKVEARVTAAVQKLQSACSADLQKYCSAVTPGEGRLIYCMMAHEDKISSACDYALYKTAREASQALARVNQAINACAGDIEKFCASIPAGEGRVAQCLMKNKASLKKVCSAALGKLPALN